MFPTCPERLVPETRSGSRCRRKWQANRAPLRLSGAVSREQRLLADLSVPQLHKKGRGRSGLDSARRQRVLWRPPLSRGVGGHVTQSCTMASTKPLSRFWEWGKNIVCVGRNYADHVKEMRSNVLSEPVLFLKPSTAYAPEGSPVLMPAYCRNLHHEVELGVLLGRRGEAIPEAAAMDYVAGYALCLDMTARDVQEECKKKGLPWTLAKSFKSSCPVSAFVPKEKIPDPHALRLWLKVNGELRQEGKTSSMIFSIPYIISYVSKIITLEEGDLILTGTPKGVGPVKENDEIEAGIDGVVSMRFKVERSGY